MRASTQHVQDRLNQPYDQQTTSQLPIGTAVIVAWLAGAMFMLSLAPYGYWIIALISPACYMRCCWRR
ncbi:Uncharacterised protein [Psychrobacter phenylpyruvicus]|uniref:Uncharacterized protein n=1 Tax=Psychrobacter phenylpyruvicus TaxID=29432 RepID=A0A379LGP9_9GAMM|nr:Uncharacterised protein [Psychrobacter phenylpyruvicus]